MVFAEKTMNIYKMSKEGCAKFINDNVTKTSQKRHLKRKSPKKQNTFQKSQNWKRRWNSTLINQHMLHEKILKRSLRPNYHNDYLTGLHKLHGQLQPCT